MESPKTYNTRLKRRSSEFSPKSRVDWKRTRVSLIVDSDETSDSEEEGSESDDSSSVSAEETEERTEEVSGQPEDEGEEERIKKPRRKSRTTTIESSGSSSDSDAPGTTVPIRRCRAIEEDEDEDKQNRARGEQDEEDKAQFKKKRMDTLKQLAARRRSRNQRVGSESEEEESHDNEFIPLTPESLEQEEEEEEDSQEMADFIEEDDEEDGSLLSIREVFMKHHMDKFASDDLDSHLQKVIHAFLINIADNTFLETLYNGSRQKRYARDLLKSLNYLDERVITPRLEKLTSSCRWTSQYKERVNCYPRLLVRVIEAEKQSCEACKLRRYCKYLVTLSGEVYDGHTLEKDDFLLDDKQMLVVGTTCAERTETYHPVKHYKYHLYRRCRPFLPESEEDSAKERVAMALSRMEEEQFIEKEVKYLELLLKGADFFQPEEAESLIS